MSSLAVLSGAKIPHRAADSSYGDVLYLYRGTGAVTKDDGPFDVSSSVIGSGFALNGGVTFHGLLTYEAPAANSYLEMASDAYIATELTNKAFCLEYYVYPVAWIPPGDDGRFMGLGRFSSVFSSAGLLSVTHANIGSSSYTLYGGVQALETWIHVAFVREKGVVWDYLKLYVGGVLQDTSVQIATANAVVNAAEFGRVLGFNSVGTSVRLSNHRLTGNHSRYLSDFTPPSVPFPASV